MTTSETRPFRLSLLLVSLLLAGVLLHLPGTLPAAQAAIGEGSASPFGMNIQAAARYPGQDWNGVYGKAQEAGIGWSREEIRWDAIQNFGYGRIDTAINTARGKNISILGLLGYSLEGRSKSIRFPADLNAYDNYVRGVVNRYKDRVKHWQVWNEPDDPQYFTPKSGGAFEEAAATDYGELLGRTYDVIKSADPGAVVVSAGISPTRPEFMDKVLQRGGKADIYAFHPYVNDPVPANASSLSPESVYWVVTNVNQMRAFAARNGNKPIWATEFGWAVERGRRNVSRDDQANFIVRAYAMGLTAGIDKMFVYFWSNDTTDPAGNYGIVERDFTSPTTSYNAYRTMVNVLRGTTPLGQIEPAEISPSYINLSGFEGGGQNNNCGSGQGNDSGTFVNCFASPAASVSLNTTGEQKRNGGQSLKISYNFTDGARDRYVIVAAKPFGQRRATRVGFWAYGDASNTQFWLNVRSPGSALTRYQVGRSGPPSAGWQRFEARLDLPFFDLADGGGPADVNNINRLELLLDGWPKSTNYGGAIFVDDMYAVDSPPVYVYRFAKGGDQVVDVVWADGQGATQIPTRSGRAGVVSRDGNTGDLAAQDGKLPVSVGGGPVYVTHNPAPIGTPGGGGGDTSGCSGPGDGNLRGRFDPTWERFDEAIVTGRVSRSWLWGPKENIGRFVKEAYDEAPGGCRTVLYWDKSRMEITQPGGNQNDKYYVTNGLLARELVSGKMQVGNARYIDRGAAQVPAAGDDGANENAPTYASFAGVATLDNDKRRENRGNALVTDTIGRGGNVGNDGSKGGYNVRLERYEPGTGHNIADVFWRFMNSQGPIKVNGQYVTGDAVDWIYSIGLPLTEPYWARVKVGGVEKDVLIQIFERRALTYTPSNQAAFQVEMGNIGRAYAAWRYGSVT
jgi:polysaccharide biosynthesis protein PslG